MKFIPKYITTDILAEYGEHLTHEAYNEMVKLNSSQGDYNTKVLNQLFNTDEGIQIPYLDKKIKEVTDDQAAINEDMEQVVADMAALAGSLSKYSTIVETRRMIQYATQDFVKTNKIKAGENVEVEVDALNNVIISATGGGGGDVTKDYVDEQDATTLQSAKGYTDTKISQIPIPVVPTDISAFNNDVGYITGYTETDPIFSASAAAGITNQDITDWNNKLSVETDPIFSASPAASILSTDITNWNNAVITSVDLSNAATLQVISQLMNTGYVTLDITEAGDPTSYEVLNNAFTETGFGTKPVNFYINNVIFGELTMPLQANSGGDPQYAGIAPALSGVCTFGRNKFFCVQINYDSDNDKYVIQLWIIDTSNYVDKASTQAISGSKLFTTIPQTNQAPTANHHITNKEYVDSVLPVHYLELSNSAIDILGLKKGIYVVKPYTNNESISMYYSPFRTGIATYSLSMGFSWFYVLTDITDNLATNTPVIEIQSYSSDGICYVYTVTIDNTQSPGVSSTSNTIWETVGKTGSQTISGTKTFSNAPKSNQLATDNTALANRATIYKMFGDNYSSSSTYNIGDVVAYINDLYICDEDNVTGSWDSTKWTQISSAPNIYNRLKTYVDTKPANVPADYWLFDPNKQGAFGTTDSLHFLNCNRYQQPFVFEGKTLGMYVFAPMGFSSGSQLAQCFKGTSAATTYLSIEGCCFLVIVKDYTTAATEEDIAFGWGFGINGPITFCLKKDTTAASGLKRTNVDYFNTSLYVSTQGTETIGGTKTFSILPRVSSTANPTNISQLLSYYAFMGLLTGGNYDINKTYNTGQYTRHDNHIWQCNADNVTGVWDATKWTDLYGTSILDSAINYVNNKYVPTYETYPTTETRVGTWTDGKPLYRIVIPLGALPADTQVSIQTGFASTYGIVRKFECYGYHSQLNGTTNITNQYQGPTLNIRSSAYIDAVKVTAVGDWSGWDGYAILDYTKASD